MWFHKFDEYDCFLSMLNCLEINDYMRTVVSLSNSDFLWYLPKHAQCNKIPVLAHLVTKNNMASNDSHWNENKAKIPEFLILWSTSDEYLISMVWKRYNCFNKWVKDRKKMLGGAYSYPFLNAVQKNEGLPAYVTIFTRAYKVNRLNISFTQLQFSVLNVQLRFSLLIHYISHVFKRKICYRWKTMID